MQTAQVGTLLREWRQRRRLSQLDLACDANVSTRHISFIETGRSQPSREMILQLAERLHVPLRERNALLAAGGYAHTYRESGLDDPRLRAATDAIQVVLSGHEPYPALAVDRHWTLLASNRAVAPLLTRVDPKLLTPPANVLRLSMHPQGLAPQILNLSQWRAHVLARLQQQIDTTADPFLTTLREELSTYPYPENAAAVHGDHSGIFIPLRLTTDSGDVSLIGTTMIFGTALDITLSEVAVESFFPADERSAEILRTLSARHASPHQ